MPDRLTETTAPQAPKKLTVPLEIIAQLRIILENRTPLDIRFSDHNELFQSYLIELDRDNGLIGIDEMIPRHGDRLLRVASSYSVNTFHEGVRLSWSCSLPAQITIIDGAPCYWSPLPEVLYYHQRRNAFRAPILSKDVVGVVLADESLPDAIPGELIDLSITGCKLKFPGNLARWLKPGEVYVNLNASMPFGPLSIPIKLRHITYDEKKDISIIGVHFEKLEPLELRNVERLVNQLQREMRRRQKSELF